MEIKKLGVLASILATTGLAFGADSYQQEFKGEMEEAIGRTKAYANLVCNQRKGVFGESERVSQPVDWNEDEVEDLVTIENIYGLPTTTTIDYGNDGRVDETMKMGFSVEDGKLYTGVYRRENQTQIKAHWGTSDIEKICRDLIPTKIKASKIVDNQVSELELVYDRTNYFKNGDDQVCSASYKRSLKPRQHVSGEGELKCRYSARKFPLGLLVYCDEKYTKPNTQPQKSKLRSFANSGRR